MRKAQGQIVIGAVILLVILAILVPAIIMYVQNESKWTVKEEHTTRAFELAESAVERGYLQTVLSTTTYSNVQAGTPPTGFNFDQVYTDLPGGQYEIRLSSGPNQLIVTGVAEDTSGKELRAVQAIYTNGASQNAIYSLNFSSDTNTNVEWGSIMSQGAIWTNQNWPRFYTASSFNGKANVPPNTDSLQYWQYQTNLPSFPKIDLNYYLNQATAQGNVITQPCGTNNAVYGTVAAGTYWINPSGCSSVSFGKNSYFPSPSFVIVNGDMTSTKAASIGQGSAVSAKIPQTAWENYGKNAASWAHYLTMDPAAPASYAAALAASYKPVNHLYNINNLLVGGLLYINGSLILKAGATVSIHGTLIINNNSDLENGNVTVYDDDSINVQTTTLSLSRTSWQDWSGCSWSGTNPTCP